MKTAYWIRQSRLFRAPELYCSACRTKSDRASRVCPACGARMKKTKHDPIWVDEAEAMAAMLDEDW